MTSQLQRPIISTKLLLQVAAVGGTLPQTFKSSLYPSLFAMAKGAVANITDNSSNFWAVRLWEREKVSSLRWLAIEGVTPGAGTIGIAIALVPRITPIHGIAAADAADNKAVIGSGRSLARIARATLTVDSALIIPSDSYEPFTGATLLGSPPRALRPFSGITWARRDSSIQFADDGFATGNIGQINLDLSYTEFVCVSVEAISSGTPIGGVACGIDIESQ